jgi:hypothetical protein
MHRLVRRAHSEVLICEQKLVRRFVLVPNVEPHGLPGAGTVLEDGVGREPGHLVDS